MNAGSSTSGGSSRPAATPVSMTQILEWIDPSELPPRVQETLRELGPSLASGLTLKEIAEQNGRQKDWASARVAEARAALIEAALERAPEMDTRLRAHLEELRRSVTAPAAG